MMDNEEPWKPPELQRLTEAPRLPPQVPEVTIISTENKISNTKGNFLQRAMLTEKTLKQASADHQNLVKYQPIIQDKFGEPFRKSPNVPKDDNKAYSPVITKSLVPDVTILEDTEDSSKKKFNSTERVFTNSYKEMMINSHDQFLKQFNRDQTANQSSQNHNKMEQMPLARYKQNPLSKYIPSPETNKNHNYNDGNSSSILIDVDVPQKKEENDEVTFKKVAEMLSEIQKLVITEKPQQIQSPNSSSSNLPKVNKIEILKKLASAYLTSEELIQYNVDNELSELEKCQF